MKKVLSVLLVLCMVFALAACGGGTNDATTGDGVVDVCVASEPESIDPAHNTAVDGAIMIQHAFEGLIKWVDDGKGNATLAPGMAESWDKSDDELTWTFHIREDAVWSDGEPVTANDFVYSWNRLVAKETAADYEYMVDMVKGYGTGGNLDISAPDDKTFVVNLNAKCAYFEEICAFPATFPVRQDIIEQYGDQWTFDPATYISNGPFVMAEWVHNSYIRFVPNENYYGAADVTAKEIKFHLMDDANAMYAAFRNGELDFIEEVPQDEIQALLKSGDLIVGDYIGTYYVCFQTERAPFDDPLVREAFSLAIDRNYICYQVTGRGEVPATGYVPAGIYDAAGPGSDFREIGGDYYSVADADYQANCDKARELLAEAGYPNGEGFPVVEYLYNTNEGHKAIGEALQNMWQTELGVTVTLQNQEWNTFLQERKNGNYSVARNGWIADYNDPMSFLDMWLTGGGNNDAQYKNSEYDAIIAQAKASSDSDERMSLMHDAEDILIGQDKVLAPVYFYTQPYMINPDLKGMYYTPLGYFFFGYTTGV